MRPVRGMQVAIVSAGPAHALYFSCYEFLKETFTSKFGINSHLAHGKFSLFIHLFYAPDIRVKKLDNNWILNKAFLIIEEFTCFISQL